MVHRPLDHIYTNCIFVSENGLATDAISDHTPVYALKKQPKTKHPTKTIIGRNYKNYSSENLSAHLSESDWTPLQDEKNPTVIYDAIIGKITEYLDENCPIVERRVPSDGKH